MNSKHRLIYLSTNPVNTSIVNDILVSCSVVYVSILCSYASQFCNG
jgi:hypothetical protein